MNLKQMIKKNPYIFYKIQRVRFLIKQRRYKKMSINEKKEYLNNIYKSIFKNEINWDKPIKLSEKIQYEKIYPNNDEIKAKLSDKYEVREWVKEKIGEEYLIPLIGVYNSFEEINFDLLPNQFVIKCNHDSGSVTIVNDKNKLNLKKLKYKYHYHLKNDFSIFTFENQYSLIKPKIVIEKYINDTNGQLNDYKFWCFNSKVYYCRVDYDRFGKHKRSTYDLDWNLLPWIEGNYEINYEHEEKPQNFDEMVTLVEKLCDGFPEVRVDLYNVDGKIYFGEMTFSSASGFEYIPEDVDIMLGNLWGNESSEY